MFSQFFIDRPILANVIAIVTILLGVVALTRLPIAQYPEITPPTVVVSTAYPGAGAEVVADTIGGPIEQEVNGVEGMLYMSSSSTNEGAYSLTVTFAVGTNLDMATVLVQNRVNVATARLPEDVKRQGVTVKKRSPSFLMVVALNSPDGRYDDLYISNFANLSLKDELARVAGVGDVMVFGAADYSMRVWLDPAKLKAYGLSSQDVLKAMSEQNVQVAAGQIGQPPYGVDQAFQLSIRTQGRLQSVQQFEDIIIRADDGSSLQGATSGQTLQNGQGTPRVLRVRDVARVELGGQKYDVFAEMGGKPSGVVVIYLMPGANALDVAKAVEKRMHQMTPQFPEGLAWYVPYDTTKFVDASITQVYVTLLEAAGLVLLVILIFLQDWRAMLVPATTVPVTILGSFIALYMLGFSINLITLFGIVLAIGIVVDDAIIVVEGAAHHLEQGDTPRQAAIQAMNELFGPIMGITLVLISVFLPAAFLPGVTGQLYRQFALVIASTAVISAINAITLKPVQCALWLRPHQPTRNPFFRAFNWVYDRAERAYAALVGLLVRHVWVCLLVFIVLIGLTGWGFTRLPTSFLPLDDQGYCIVAVKLPDAASQSRTRQVVAKMNQVLKDAPGVAQWTTFGGLSLLDGGVTLPNAATTFVTFKDWKERGANLSMQAIIGGLMGRFMTIPDAMIFALTPPAIRGLGNTGGFEMVVQDRRALGAKALEGATWQMIGAARTQPNLTGVASTYSASTPQLFLDVSRVQAKTYGVPLSEVFATLQTNLGSAYVNDFNLFGKTYQVRAQADAPFRLTPDDIRRLEVRSNQGLMVPMGALVDVKETVGPAVVTRYNMYPSATIFGSAGRGTSSGQALKLMEDLAKTRLPAGMGFEWTNLSYQEKGVGNEAYFVFALAVVLVFLVLAAQYESWTAPAAVILAVPLALLGTWLAILLRGYDNNIYTQIGIVLLIALASKNAILIVEFARHLRSTGVGIREAAVQAAVRRLRPILMTSFAFILGVTPLLTAGGAGAASQRAIGTAVFGGMLASTLLAVLFVPVFFVIIQRISERMSEYRKTLPHQS